MSSKFVLQMSVSFPKNDPRKEHPNYPHNDPIQNCSKCPFKCPLNYPKCPHLSSKSPSVSPKAPSIPPTSAPPSSSSRGWGWRRWDRGELGPESPGSQAPPLALPQRSWRSTDTAASWRRWPEGPEGGAGAARARWSDLTVVPNPALPLPTPYPLDPLPPAPPPR